MRVDITFFLNRKEVLCTLFESAFISLSNNGYFCGNFFLFNTGTFCTLNTDLIKITQYEIYPCPPIIEIILKSTIL